MVEKARMNGITRVFAIARIGRKGLATGDSCQTSSLYFLFCNRTAFAISWQAWLSYFCLLIRPRLQGCKKWLWYYLWLVFCFTFPLSAQDVVVEASVDPNQRSMSPSIGGTVTITHPRAAEIDLHAFTLQGKPLEAEFVKDVKMGQADILVSIYHFALAAKEKGLYVLDPIAVRVGGKIYQSPATTYQIDEHVSSAARADKEVVFRLEAGVIGSRTLYPGQRTQLIYRITYNRSVGLTASELPLVHMKELRKIGDEQVKDFQQGELTIQEIIAEVEALKPGTFFYGPSYIEGYAYTLDAAGERVFDKHKLRAEAPVVELLVQPFPAATQPASFNGALGNVTAQMKLLTPAKFSIGDAIQLSIDVSGLINLREFTLPELLCQPGFAGFFQMSELPPAGHIEGDTKHFTVELRAISSFAKEIPAIELSSFDPLTQRYIVWHSEAMPLIMQNPVEDKTAFVPAKEIDWAMVWKKADHRVTPLDHNAVEVESSALTSPSHHRLSLLWMIPFATLVLLSQSYLKRRQAQRPPVAQPPTSVLLLNEALQEADLQRAAKLLQEACLRRLTEKGSLVNNDPLRKFIRELDIFQYAKESAVSLPQLKERAKILLQVLCLMLFFSASALAASDKQTVLKDANSAYLEGERATSVVARLKAFNQALSLYTSLEKEGLASSELDEVIGNSLAQLGEYPWAILYYRRALVQEPQRASLRTALELAQTNLGLEPDFSLSWSERILSFDDMFPLQERTTLFFWFAMAALVAASWCIWKPTPMARQVTKILSILMAVFLLNLLLSYYRSPLEAVLVAPTGLYRGPDMEQSQLLQKPLLAGSTLQVVDVESKGRWLKVKTADDTIGYIPFQAARII